MHPKSIICAAWVLLKFIDIEIQCNLTQTTEEQGKDLRKVLVADRVIAESAEN